MLSVRRAKETVFAAAGTGQVILVTVLSILVMLPASTASGQYFGRNKVQYDSFDFSTINTPRFEVYFYDEEEEAVRDAARMAERWYKRHSRTYLREFKDKKPLIFYANDADFQQTNVIGGSIGQGTGGVTESLKERVVMPLTGLYAETDHVLGHELVHSFQYDIGLSRQDTVGFALQLLPLWLIEGTAEYLSVGRSDPHTAMWMRDAAIRDDLPTMAQLSSDYRYFPYRFGQAYMAYVGGKYGDVAVANIYKYGGRVGLDSAFVYALGIRPDSLSKEWIQSIKDTYLPLVEGRTPSDEAGRTVLTRESTGGDLNLAPAVSPDGKWIAFLSERDLFNINLFIADAETGRVVKKLKGTGSNPHFDAIRFINSAGSWSPDGRQFVFITFVQGDNELSILDWNSGSIERRVSVEGVTAMSNPAWSPDGKSIAFSGMDGGISDLYVLDLESGRVRQLTNDRFGDLQPTWSPDGRTIAFVTDRGDGGTDFSTLQYGKVRLATIDVETGSIRVIRPFPGGRHINPQFSPDGESLFFISDYDGFKDVYRYDLRAEQAYKITALQTGVSGITGLSPAMSVALQSGRMVFSVFSNNTYSVHSLEPEETIGAPIDAPDEEQVYIAGVLPPTNALGVGLVDNYLSDPLNGLPEPTDYPAKNYSAKLQLDYVAPPTVGVSVGGPFGSGVVGGVGLYFSDMLGNHNLAVIVQANGTFKDIGGQVAYFNRRRRFNYGAGVGHIPYLRGITYPGVDEDGNQVIDQYRERVYIDNIDLQGSYPLTATKRFDIGTGFVRYGFDAEIERYTLTGFAWQREKIDLPSSPPIYFFHTTLAYVGDYANFAFTSPVTGGRYRFQVSPFVGSAEQFVRVLADYRRYYLRRPFTFAVRGLHIGNYGGSLAGGQNSLTNFSAEYLGYSNSLSFVRGYSFSNIDPFECGLTTRGCPVSDRLFGTRLALASAELRLPLFGTEQFGLVNFPYLPVELTLFSDVGLAWSRGDDVVLAFKRNTPERVPVVSTGVSTRFNLFGYIILEVFYAVPWQRPGTGLFDTRSHVGFQLVPGW
jgi:Tol biopolymer transport system component